MKKLALQRRHLLKFFSRFAFCLVIGLSACNANKRLTSNPECAECHLGGSIISSVDGMKLMYVPAGRFIMGSTVGNNDEKPVQTVSLPAFWVDQTEITNAMYAQCVKAGKCHAPNPTSSYTRAKYYGSSAFDNYPVIYVYWTDARAYCVWAGRRMLTEAEWEKAARGPNGNIYPWGNEAPNTNLLNYQNALGDTTEAGKYPAGASVYGALDMAGNVAEWVGSVYAAYPYDAEDGREDIKLDNASFVFRGGAFGDFDSYVYASHRDWLSISDNGYYVGFRCGRSA